MYISKALQKCSSVRSSQMNYRTQNLKELVNFIKTFKDFNDDKKKQLNEFEENSNKQLNQVQENANIRHE